MSFLRKSTKSSKSNRAKTLRLQDFHRTGPLEDILTPSPLLPTDDLDELDFAGGGDSGGSAEIVDDVVPEDLTDSVDSDEDLETSDLIDDGDADLDDELEASDGNSSEGDGEPLGEPLMVIEELDDEDLGGEDIEAALTDNSDASKTSESLSDTEEAEAIEAEETSEAVVTVADATSKGGDDVEADVEVEAEPVDEVLGGEATPTKVTSEISETDPELVMDLETDLEVESDPDPALMGEASGEELEEVVVDDTTSEVVDAEVSVDDEDADLADLDEEEFEEIVEELLESTGFTLDLRAIDAGVFTVGGDGLVGIDFLYDGGAYKGQLAIFSLEGLDGREFESFDAFVAETVERASSNSDRGYLVINDKTEGAKFASAENSGDYRGVKLFAMKAGDTFAVMLVPNSTLAAAADGESTSVMVRPLYSLSTANPDDELHVAQIADVTGDGSTFVMEDKSTENHTDRDYNDVVFRVTGATGEAVAMADVIAVDKDWTDSELFDLIVNEFQDTSDTEGGEVEDDVITDDTTTDATDDTNEDDIDAGTDDDFTDIDDGVTGNEIPIPDELQDIVIAAQTLESEPVAAQPLIGVIDSGLTAGNADLDYANVTLGSDFVGDDANPLLDTAEGSKHGDHILGIIAAEQDNGEGIDGINDDAPLFVSRAISSGETAAAIVEFVDAAIASEQPNAVLNLSLDLTQVDADGNVTTRYEFTPEERGAIEYARQNGVILVVAAGNNADTMSVLGQASQEFDNIITVGAAKLELVDGQWQASPTDYSSYGEGLDVVAYGGVANNPVESLEANGTGTAFGSSVATAKVTGAISRIWAVNPDLSYRQIIDIVKTTATDLGVEGNDVETGAGLVNLAAAVALAKVATPEDYKPEALFSPDAWSGEGFLLANERAAGVFDSVPSGSSNAISTAELNRLNAIRPTINKIASEFGVHPAIIAGIISRETNTQNILGDGGRGHGYMQLDIGTFPNIKNQPWQDTEWNIRAGVNLLINDKYQYLKSRIPQSLHLQGSIAAYNCGQGNVVTACDRGLGVDTYTTGKNYSADVLSRARFLIQKGWGSSTTDIGTSPEINVTSGVTPWKMSAAAKGTGQVAVGRNADGRLEAFTVGPNGTVYQSWQLVPNGGWSNWQPLSNKLTAKSVTVAANADGRLEVFAIGGDDKLYQVWQTKPNSSWSNWQQLSGTTVKDVTVGQNSDGRLEVFAIGTDSKVYHTWQSAPNASWVGLNQLAGGIAKSVSVGRNADGRLEVFAIGTDDKVYQVVQNGANGAGGWGNWKALSNGSAKDLVVGQNADGRLEAFIVGLDNKVYQAFQTSPNGNWGSWYSLSGGSAQSLAVGRNQDGRLEVFAKGLDGKVYQVSQTAPNGGWSSWQPLLSSGNVGDLTVSQSQDGRLEAFTMTGQTDFKQAWQVKPNSSWIGWSQRQIQVPSSIPSSPPIPGTNGVPSDAGQYVRTVKNTSGVVQFFYENGLLQVQPNGQKNWYWTTSQNLLQVGRGSRSPQIFQTAYNKINGTSQGLKPQGDAYRWGNGWTQKFLDKSGSEMLLMLEDGASEAFWMWHGNLGEYKQMGGPIGHLGYPRSNEIALPNKPSGSVYQVFATENGKSRIHYSPKTGSVATWGSIGRQYTDIGGAYHWLGMPTRREYTYGSDTIFSDFEGGKIAHQKSTGKVEVLKPGETASWLKSANVNIELKPGSKNLDFYRGQVWETNGYKFTFQTDGNLILYSPTGKVLWAAGSEIHGANRFSVQTDGNVVLYRDNIPLWATDTAGNPGSRFAIQPDGNLVVYSSSGKPIFNTGTHQGKEVTRVASPIWIRDQSLKRFPNLHFSTIQSVATGKALDAGGKNNSVYQYPSPNASNPYHQWGFHKVGDYYMIINKATGFALDAGRDGGKYPYGYVNPMTNNDYHLWKVTPNGSGYQIVSKATGRALDAGGNTENPVYMYPNPISGNSYHQWNLNLPGGGPTTQTGSSLAELDKKSRLTIDEIIQYRQLVANLPSSQRATYYRRLQYKVPYFNQRDNGYRNIADSMCNVTTLAACLTFLGIKNPQPSRQFEDVLEDIIQNYSWHGTDTNPRYWWKNFADLARKEFGVSNPGFAMMQGFPVGDVKFIENFVKENWEPSLNNGKAIMTSVSTTSYGHIVKVIDIDWQRGGIVVDDPFGKAQDSPGNSSGKSNYTNFWNTKDRNPVNTQQGQDEGGIGNDNFWSWSYCTEILGATPYLILG